MKDFRLYSAWLVFISLLFLSGGCFLFHDSSPKETLPPATQTGANTFGCYVNGKLWLPKGYNGTSNLRLSYDPSFNKGTFDLRCYRYPTASNWQQYIILFSDSLSSTGTYSLATGTHQVVSFTDTNACGLDGNDSLVLRSGDLAITKFDLVRGIISGTFQFTLVKLGCDTIKVTEGRFDKKL